MKTTSVDLQGVTIFIVDDEADTRALLIRLLSDCGAEVTAFPGAAEALEALRQRTPHVLISDIGMPVMDGYEFMQGVRAMEASSDREVPTIALTAFARSEDRTRAMIAGFDMHVAKPIEARELLATVANLAGRRGRNGK